jgi:argininosuccinate lyase
MKKTDTLWSPGARPDPRMMAYTVGDDREVDARLLRWDVLGSLGHVEALARGGIVSARERGRMRRALLAALRAVENGGLRIEPRHEDVHSAVELWLTEHFGDVGERIHTGRSRNDQIVVDMRLYLKSEVLLLHTLMTEFAGTLLQFAREYRRTVWPGYTHQRIAMPSSGGLWAAGYAEGLLDVADGVIGFWSRLDRSPLGSAAGYGVPLPLDRESAARALGFAAIDQVVTTTQNGRGQLEAQVLFWCAAAAHECAKLSTDVILFSADEFGWLMLPAEWSTGSTVTSSCSRRRCGAASIAPARCSRS